MLEKESTDYKHINENHDTETNNKRLFNKNTSDIPDGYFMSHLEAQEKDKIRVADYVCENLVTEGDSIALDAGTSPMYVAKSLFEKYSKMNLSILTHNMEVFKKFGTGYKRDITTEMWQGTNIQLILTGGEFSPSYNALFGVQTESAYNEYFPRLVILAISGLISSNQSEYEDGLYCHATIERPVKKLLFTKPTDRRVVVADWKKLGRPDSYRLGEITKLTIGVSESVTIVTTKPPKNEKQGIKAQFKKIVENLQNDLKVKVITL